MSLDTRITTPSEPQQYEIDFIKTGVIGKAVLIEKPIAGIEKVVMQKSASLLWNAILRTDGKFEFRMLDMDRVLSFERFDSLTAGSFCVTWHKYERPTDRKGCELLTSLGWIDPRAAFDEVWEQVSSKRKCFVIPDSGKMSTPFKDLDFWQWLDINEPNGDHNSITTKKKYLNSLGFNIYKHCLDPEDSKMLRYTLNHHWDANFKPSRIGA